MDKHVEDCYFALKIIEKKRKTHTLSETLTGWFTKPDYNQYTEGENSIKFIVVLCKSMRIYRTEEAMAEQCYCEISCMLMLAAFIGDQSLFGLIKALRRYIACHAAAKCVFIFQELSTINSSNFLLRCRLCLEIAKNKTNWESECVRRNFECG